MNWKPGDIALCIKSGKRTRSGHKYVVYDVLEAMVPDQFGNKYKTPSLTFLELPPEPTRGSRSCTSRFIKIDPENIEYDLRSDETRTPA